ncbi:MAG: hypothetical protein ACREEM_34425 [Blastocatellia bacterium]
MTSQAGLAVSETPQRVANTWIVAMPGEIADAFGVSEGSIVTLFMQPGSVAAMMNLATQTAEARNREPGWFVEMPVEMAAAAGATEGTFIAIYAKQGSVRAEILPQPSPEFAAIADGVIEKNKELLEDLKRLGD